jgi:hypothetical protein
MISTMFRNCFKGYQNKSESISPTECQLYSKAISIRGGEVKLNGVCNG